MFHWDPVAHLDFDLELLYQSTNQTHADRRSPPSTGYAPWQGNTNGLEGRFEVTRDF